LVFVGQNETLKIMECIAFTYTETKATGRDKTNNRIIAVDRIKSTEITQKGKLLKIKTIALYVYSHDKFINN
jgi:translation initiation factor IF-3